MQLYVPLAEMSLDAGLLAAVGALGGFLSGMFGVGGAFVVTPLLIIIGVPSAVAVGTQSAQLAGTALSGAILKNRKGDIDLRMGLVLAIGSLGGVSLGALLFQRLRHAGEIDLAINLGYALILSLIGFFMLRESVATLRKAEGFSAPDKRPWGATWKFAVRFPASKITVSVISPLLIGFGCGILTAIFGVGSGFILVPAMLYILRMPASLIAGTSMFQILFTASYATVIQSIVNHNVDIVLAVVLLVGSLIGVRAGTYASTRISPERARILLATIILLGGAKLWWDLILQPDELYMLSVGRIS